MKTKITTLVLLLFISLSTFAQQGINYKALIRDNTGNAVANQLIVVEFDILESGTTLVYQEQHTPTTDANGIIVLTIGQGTVLSGDFNTITWEANPHFLNVQVNTGSGLVDMGTTEFMAVPYAKHADTAANVSGLEKITESVSSMGVPRSGWRLIGQDSTHYGNIGLGAVDLSTYNFLSTTKGATGDEAVAMGYATTASGDESTAMGYDTTASGRYSTAIGESTNALGATSLAMGRNTTASGHISTAMGEETKAEALNSTAIGKLNIGGGDPGTWVGTDPLFEIGNGDSTPSNALTVLKNGTITAPSFDMAEITDSKALITKEYLDVNAGATSINELTDGKSDNDGTNNGSSLFLGIDAGLNDDQNDNRNIGIGYQALYSNTTGFYNSANGFKALFSNTTGNNNTANGSRALYSNTTGNNNTANGSRALFSNTTGNNNTANGILSLYSNTTGNYNTANGYQALYNNTTGNNNTANGILSLYSNTTGNYNTAIGEFALFNNTTGDSNTANGVQALYSNTTGTGNVALGYRAGYNETGSNKLYIANSNTTIPLIYGDFNTKKMIVNGQLTALARNSDTALDLIIGGTENTTLGDDGYISSNPNYASSDLFLRSYDAFVVQLDYDNNESGNFEIKNGAGTVVFDVNEAGDVRVNGSLIHASDRRLKKDIETLPYGLSEILQLQPKAYNWKDRDQDHKSLGLIAQEVQPIISEVVSKTDDAQQTLGISYTELIPVLINAIKEQQEIINKLKAQVNTDQATITNQQEMMQALLIRVKAIEDKQEEILTDNN